MQREVPIRDPTGSQKNKNKKITANAHSSVFQKTQAAVEREVPYKCNFYASSLEPASLSRMSFVHQNSFLGKLTNPFKYEFLESNRKTDTIVAESRI